MTKPTLIALMNQKGGVGKTNVALNLAAANAQKNRPTFILDLDQQGSATVNLNFDKTSNGVEDVLEGRTDFPSCIQHFRQPKAKGMPLFLIPPGKEMKYLGRSRDMKQALAVPREAVSHYATLLRDNILSIAERLAETGSQLDKVFIDLPPSFGIATDIGLLMADKIIVPATPDTTSIEGLAEMLVEIKEKQADNPRLEMLGMLVTRDKPHVPSILTLREAMTKAYRQTGGYVFKSTIPERTEALTAQAFGYPVVLNAPSHAVAVAYREAAAELDALLEKEQANG